MASLIPSRGHVLWGHPLCGVAQCSSLLMSGTPQCGQTMSGQFTHLTIDGCFYLAAIANRASVGVLVWDFLWMRVCLFWVYAWGWDGWVTCYLPVELLETLPRCCPGRLCHFATPAAAQVGSNLALGSLALAVVSLSDSSHPSGHEVVFHCSFYLRVPDDSQWWASFHGLIGCLDILFGEMSFKSFAQFFNWVICLFIVRVLCIF